MGSLLANEAVAVTKLHARSALQVATERLPGRCALLQMADDEGLIPNVKDVSNVAMRMQLLFHDADVAAPGLRLPDSSYANAILHFYQRAEAEGVEHFVAQCQAGVGRSVAVCGAIDYLKNESGRPSIPPTYNRMLFREIVMAGGGRVPVEPLVSLAVRVKYDLDKLNLFLLSVKAQRYDSWEVVAFTDGPNAAARDLVGSLNDDRFRLIETPEVKGRWGHPYRQMAFDACNGEWIGPQNDDNYLTPGFIEQLVAETSDAVDVVTCQSLHRYSAWGVVAPGGDLSTWIARADLVHKTPWHGAGFLADQEYLQSLIYRAGQDRVKVVNRPLVVKN